MARPVPLALMLLGVVAVLAFEISTMLKDPVSAEREATALHDRLASERGAAAVSRSGSDVRLADGGVTLSVRKEGERELRGADSPAHFHVTARRDGASAGLEACIYGTGTGADAQLSDAAHEYAEFVLPVVESALLDRALPRATDFSGTEKYGVAGFRGLVGHLAVRGDTPLSGDRDARVLFTGVPNMPSDGRPHLLKAVATVETGRWLRTVECDGEQTLLRDATWPGVPVPSVPMVVVQFAAVTGPDRRTDASAREAALAELAKSPSWLPSEDQCPDDALPKSFVDTGFSEEACAGGRLAECLASCKSANARACYEAGLEVESDPLTAHLRHRLYLSACLLGEASGCNNAAAGRDESHPGIDPCSMRTFEHVCDRAKDPWACSMVVFHLVSEGTAPPPAARLREFVDGACRLSEDDPACINARHFAAVAAARRDGGLARDAP